MARVKKLVRRIKTARVESTVELSTIRDSSRLILVRVNTIRYRPNFTARGRIWGLILALSMSHIELNRAAHRTGVSNEADHVMLRLNQPVVGNRARPVGLSTKNIEAIVTNIISEEHSIKHIYRLVFTSSSVVTKSKGYFDHQILNRSIARFSIGRNAGLTRMR